MEDIAPKMLENIKKDFESRFSNSNKIKELYKRIKSGNATYKDAHEFAIETGKILSFALKKNIRSSELPDGRMYYNIADRIIRPMLKNNYELITEVSAIVQETLNKAANIGIKAIKPEFNTDRAQGIIDIVSGKDKYDDIAYMFDEPITNFSQSIVDDSIRANADFQYRSGLSPKIIRTSTGKCCKWCDKLAGVYDYADVSNTGNDVFRRHKHCRCLVEYELESGKRQNVHTKEIQHINEQVKQRKNFSKIETGNSVKLKSIAFDIAGKRGLKPLTQEKVVEVLRKESENWIVNLTEQEKKAISKYTFNGTDDDGKKLYEKINLFLDGKYDARNDNERKLLERMYMNIKNSVLKNKLKEDIIVYRRDYKPNSLQGIVNKFLSTSVTHKGTLGANPNVAIIVPKGSEGAYIEGLSLRKKQREFLINSGNNLKKIYDDGNLYIYEVIQNEK